MRTEHFQFCFRLLDTHACFEPGDEAEVIGFAVESNVGTEAEQRTPGVGGVVHAISRESAVIEGRFPAGKRLGRDAHDGEILAVQTDGLADDMWTRLEMALPKPMAQHNHGRPVCRTVFLGQKITSQGSVGAEEREIVSRHHMNQNRLAHRAVFGLLRFAERKMNTSAGGHGGKRLGLITIELVLRMKDAAWFQGVDHLFGLLDARQRPQRRGIEERKERDVRPHPQRERQHGHGSEAGSF